MSQITIYRSRGIASQLILWGQYSPNTKPRQIQENKTTDQYLMNIEAIVFHKILAQWVQTKKNWACDWFKSVKLVTGSGGCEFKLHIGCRDTLQQSRICPRLVPHLKVYHINKLKKKNDVILLIYIEKACDRIQHSFMINRNSGDLSQFHSTTKNLNS